MGAINSALSGSISGSPGVLNMAPIANTSSSKNPALRIKLRRLVIRRPQREKKPSLVLAPVVLGSVIFAS